MRPVLRRRGASHRGDSLGHRLHGIESQTRIDVGDDRAQGVAHLLGWQSGAKGDPAAGQIEHASNAGALDDGRLLHREIPLLTRGLVGGIDAHVGHNSDHSSPWEGAFGITDV